MKDETLDEFWPQVGGKTRFPLLTTSANEALNKAYGSIMTLARATERIPTGAVVKAYRVLLNAFNGEDSPLAAREAFEAFLVEIKKENSGMAISAETAVSLENVKARFAKAFEILEHRSRYRELVAKHFRALLFVFMADRDPSAMLRADMRELVLHGYLKTEQLPLLVDLLKARDTFVENDDLDGLDAYVKAVAAFQGAAPERTYPNLDEFRDNLWVEGLWRAQASLA